MVYVAVTFRSLLGTWDLFWSSHGVTREISIHLLQVPSHDPPESIYLYGLFKLQSTAPFSCTAFSVPRGFRQDLQ